jgi:hypothetical protein
MTDAIGPGDFVECVDASPDAWGWFDCPLVVGAIYTVHECATGTLRPDGAKGRGLRLDRHNPPIPRGFWGDHRFKPVYRPKQSLIRDLLEPIKETA